MLKISNLIVEVEKKKILNGLSLEIKKGEVVALMGPNGSGKSTLAQVVVGHPVLEVMGGEILFKKKNILEMSPDERSREGIFLANQYPVAIPGLQSHSLLWQIYKWRSKDDKKRMNLGDFRIWVSEMAEKVGINHELLKRSLNDGFSGGEKKKMEILQMLVMRPTLIILDEIDSGLDVDALAKIFGVVDSYLRESGATLLVITHYSRIFKYLRPDRVLLMDKGRVVKSGKYDLVEIIEEKGYKGVEIK